MSIYKELNSMQLDVSTYEEELLTEIEQKRWKKRVLNKLHKRKRSNPKKWIGIAAILILALGMTTPLGKSTLAQMPFVGGVIERFIDQEKPLDYSPYKTAIGETAQNKYGKLTLNEVLVEADRLLISSTFEPAKGVKFDYQTFLTPYVLVNGKDIQTARGAQSVHEDNDMYTIYGDIKLKDLPNGDSLQLKITYDTFNKRKQVAIEEPWVFDVAVSTNQIKKDSTTFQLNKTITLYNGEQVTLKKVIASPVSTLLYYDLTQANERTYFKIVSASGQEWRYNVGYLSSLTEETSSVRFKPIDLKKEMHYLVPIDENNKKVGPRVEIQ